MRFRFYDIKYLLQHCRIETKVYRGAQGELQSAFFYFVISFLFSVMSRRPGYIAQGHVDRLGARLASRNIIHLAAAMIAFFFPFSFFNFR